MLFKVLRGTHYRDGKVYRKGDTIETSLDLVAMFGKARFERNFEAEQRTGSVVVNKPDIPPPVDEAETQFDGSDDSIDYGEDVTSEFPTAEKIEVLVFEKLKWYTVVDKADGEVLNEKKLRRKDVEPFLGLYLDENTDED